MNDEGGHSLSLDRDFRDYIYGSRNFKPNRIVCLVDQGSDIDETPSARVFLYECWMGSC